jgi:glycerol dehydrogenase
VITGDTVRLSAYTIGENAIGALASALGDAPVAVITGEKSWAAAGPRLPGLKICAYIPYGGACTMETIARTAQAATQAGAGAVLGVGGGRALDAAKAAAQSLGLPVYAVPTIAATCAAVTALSIVYHADGRLDRFIFSDEPPRQAFIDTALLAAAPSRYFRAGMLDAMAKHLECTFAMRGDEVGYADSLGRAISETIFDPLLRTGAQAYRDCLSGRATPVVADALQRVIVSTGNTSLLISEQYNGAVAHSVCYGLGALPGVEARALHGELVGYGCLVQLALDGDAKRLAALRAFLQEVGAPIRLADMGVAFEEAALATVITETLAGPDMRKLPYPVTDSMLLAAMAQVERMAPTPVPDAELAKV